VTLQQIIDESNNIVFFGGAGVSTESGIPDFRSVDGLYHQQYDYPPEQIISHSFFACAGIKKGRAQGLHAAVWLKRKHLKSGVSPTDMRTSRILCQNFDFLHCAHLLKKCQELPTKSV